MIDARVRDVVVDVTDLYREFGADRPPPGQRETADFPVRSRSGTPAVDPDDRRFEAWGAVADPLAFDLGEFRSLPSETRRGDLHCVTGWSRLGVEFLTEPERGLRERRGYSVSADPWAEERYS